MLRRTTLICALAAAVLLAAPPASAKGPTGATIEGEGVPGVIEIDEPGELGQGTPMSDLVEAAGFFPLVLEDRSAATSPPTDSLGLPLLITWRMGDDVVIEEIYLHAAGGPVAHVASGQPIWDGTATTSGGWLRISRDIATPLGALGVPEPAVAHLRRIGVDAAPAPTADVAATPKGVIAPEATATPPAAPSRTAAPAGSATSRSVTVGLLAMAALGGAVGVAAWRSRRRPSTH